MDYLVSVVVSTGVVVAIFYSYGWKSKSVVEHWSFLVKEGASCFDSTVDRRDKKPQVEYQRPILASSGRRASDLARKAARSQRVFV